MSSQFAQMLGEQHKLRYKRKNTAVKKCIDHPNLQPHLQLISFPKKQRQLLQSDQTREECQTNEASYHIDSIHGSLIGSNTSVFSTFVPQESIIA